MSTERTPPAIVSFFTGIVIRPIREGRVRDTGWPTGLLPIVVLASVAFVLAISLILGGPVIRAGSSLTASVGGGVLTLPRFILPTVLWLVIIALALMQTSALHVRRSLSVILTVMTVLVVLFIGALDLGADGAGGFRLTAGKVASVIAAIALIAFTVVRRRSRFAWWEFAAVFALLGVSVAIAIGGSAAQSAVFGIDVVPTAVAIIMTAIGQLAVPAALAAGVVVAQVAVTASRSAVAVTGRRAGSTSTRLPLLLGALLIVVAVWRVADVALPALLEGGLDSELLAALPGSAALLVLVVAPWWGLSAMRGTPGPDVDGVEAGLERVAIPVAIGLTITIAPIVMLLLSIQIAASWGLPPSIHSLTISVAGVLGSSTVVAINRSIIGAVLIVIALVLARRGSRGAPEILAAIGLLALASTIPSLVGVAVPWSSDALAMLIAAATLTALVVLLVRRRLDESRAALLATSLVLSAAMAWREVIADPLSIVIGSSGIALVLFGFVWGFVTEAKPTHGDSLEYPRPARVLLFLANAVFGVTVLAFGVLARDLDVPLNLDSFAQFGDQLLGTALILGAVVALWSALAVRSSVDSVPEGRSVAS